MRRYEEKFKLMIVQKNKEGESITNLSREFNIGISTIHKWVKMYRDTKSFKEVDQLTEEQKEIKRLKKELKDKEMEVVELQLKTRQKIGFVKKFVYLVF